ncbi:hypothetical protein [Mannheimia indoligenes]|uniref:hypothetical protein n=1 Tax=Mannheimia indoligenes TaxID=3103145 RepID=UPI002FE5EAAC
MSRQLSTSKLLGELPLLPKRSGVTLCREIHVDGLHHLKQLSIYHSFRSLTPTLETLKTKAWLFG